MGIAEQNMLGVAAGMATMGFVPFISTFVAFAAAPAARPDPRAHRPDRAPTSKITAGYTGLFTGRAGKTHQIVDDISIARAMPGMVVISPADEVETREALAWAAAYDGPVFMRLDARRRPQTLFDDGPPLRVRQGQGACARAAT